MVSSDRGGVWCSDCSVERNDVSSKAVDIESLNYLTRLRALSALNQADDLKTGENPSKSRDIMLDLVSYNVGKPLKSIEFLVKLSVGLQS